MSDGLVLFIGTLALPGLLVSYAVYMKAYIRSLVAQAERSGAKRMRGAIAAMLNKYADVSPDSHKSSYVGLANKVADMSLDSEASQWRRE